MFDPDAVRRRFGQYDAAEWGPFEVTVRRPMSRIRIGQHLLAHGYGELAEDLVDDGIVDMSGETEAMVLLIEALLAAPATQRQGEELAKSFGAWRL